MKTKTKSCCVLGHRKVENKEDLKIKVNKIIENLITNENVDTFYVGSKSEFDELCRDVLADQKEKHPNIQRIYVRAEYPDIDEDYENYLLQRCDLTYFPERARNAGRAVYVERNYEMIDRSDFCVIYFKEDFLPPKRRNGNNYQLKSGTGVAFRYAVQKKKIVINLAENI